MSKILNFPYNREICLVFHFFSSNHKCDEKHCRYVHTAAVLVSKCYANCIGPFAVSAVASGQCLASKMRMQHCVDLYVELISVSMCHPRSHNIP